MKVAHSVMLSAHDSALVKVEHYVMLSARESTLVKVAHYVLLSVRDGTVGTPCGRRAAISMDHQLSD